MKNPYDGGFKDLAGDHPELLLRLLGILQPGKKTQITHVPRELQLNAVQIDHGYMIEDEFGNRIELLEAFVAKIQDSGALPCVVHGRKIRPGGIIGPVGL